ncbi:hypothetical protein LWC35_17195 [Pseudonocardia kujensis]|uniref:hypothetical protein n=1 Tax=Pseudonocardia kujensis TaxID=1128675 RepID=UPI001E4AE0C3|nr:hypothetical protein [Pseudonocardia kujensis]MCE0764632.1 hypothetical protein [Pseudonocardia kujensis]
MTAALLPASRPASRPASQPVAPEVHDAVSVRVAVTGGLDGVQRVVTLLRGRGYPVRGLTADLADDDTGALGVRLPLTAEEAQLLVARLYRLPAVLHAAVG